MTSRAGRLVFIIKVFMSCDFFNLFYEFNTQTDTCKQIDSKFPMIVNGSLLRVNSTSLEYKLLVNEKI